MREIKFRAIIKYDTIQQKEAKRMGDKNTEYGIIYFTLNDLIGTITTLPKFSIRELVIPWLFQGNKPDLYTGLKDKNRKEIYEGDVIEIGEPFLHFPVKRYIIKSLQEFFEIKGYEENEMIEDWSDCKIIGNIYENPELLE